MNSLSDRWSHWLFPCIWRMMYRFAGCRNRNFGYRNYKAVLFTSTGTYVDRRRMFDDSCRFAACDAVGLADCIHFTETDSLVYSGFSQNFWKRGR